MKAWFSSRRRRRAPARKFAAVSCARSHVGRVRSINEDRVLDAADEGVWAVIDGMGGHHYGGEAAQAVLDGLKAALRVGGQASISNLITALERISAAIYGANAKRGTKSGATMVMALLAGTRLHLAWAGDSRAYLLRGGEARLLTRDHSVVQELLEAQLLDEAAARHHPQAHVVTRALGASAHLELELRAIAVRPDDRVLLCSDGLSRTFDGTTKCDRAHIEELADRLMADALSSDGSDNLSLVLIEFSPRPRSET